MRQNVIEDNIARTNRNLLVTNVILLSIVTFLSWCSLRYFTNMLFGPFPISKQELAAITDPSKLQHYYVKVTGDETLDTGFEDIETRVNRKTEEVEEVSIKGMYLGLVVDDKVLLVKSPVRTKAVSFVGELARMPELVDTKIIGSAEQRFPGIRSRVIPALLKVEDFTTFGYVGLGALIVGFCLGGFNLFRFISRNTNTDNHPIWKALSMYGKPDVIAPQINTEYNEPGVVELGTAVLTRSWILAKWMFECRPLPLTDVVWFYKHKTSRWVWFVPLPPSYAVHILSANKKRTEFEMPSDKKCDELVQAIAQRTPWAYAGYSDELVRLWGKKPDEMIQEVREAQSKSSGKQ